MFRGINSLSVDSKGRLAMPAKYRQQLLELGSGHMVLTIDRDRCLLLYPLPVWEEIECKLIQLSSTNPRARALKRLLLGHAEECGLDASGRILLPAPLREFANLAKQVVLVGQGNKFEIWNEQAWNAWRDALLASTNDGGEPLPDLDTLAF
ncbi:MAG: division/cell wall cluster transcriptional repressor MraZ [Candidatus Competibacteraceae bacterium]|nr:division/cell wall cluster transcriptional repressor MraZ [Candidatus Competibacteraceae bacterium]MBK8751229.1 division/cell wall cluster transcriptional repressor MraZ [Candidatus Competibacteraceae bacterium]